MSWSPAGCVKKQEMLLVVVSCVGDVGADDDRPSEQRSKTRYCIGWTVSVCKQEMLIVLLSGGRRTYECESQLNECTWNLCLEA